MVSASSTVSLIVDKSALKTTMYCSAVLLIKCLFSNMAIGGARVKSGGRPPEDAALFKKEGIQDF